jgi:hypothetical protein
MEIPENGYQAIKRVSSGGGRREVLMKVLETIWLFMVGLLIPIGVILYYVDIGWNPLSTNGETTTMRLGTTDPIHQVVPRSPAVDAALAEMTEILVGMKERASNGLQEVEANW